MKYHAHCVGCVKAPGRTPHGVRGLKYRGGGRVTAGVRSHPTRGAWIEIHTGREPTERKQVAPHTGCVD